MVQRAAPHRVLRARRDHQVELPWRLVERLQQVVGHELHPVHHRREPAWQQPAMTTEVRAPPRGDKHVTDGFAFPLPTDLRESGIYCSAGLVSLEPAPNRWPVLAIVTVRAFPCGLPLLACEPVTITRSPIFMVFRVQPLR